MGGTLKDAEKNPQKGLFRMNRISGFFSDRILVLLNETHFEFFSERFLVLFNEPYLGVLLWYFFGSSLINPISGSFQNPFWRSWWTLFRVIYRTLSCALNEPYFRVLFVSFFLFGFFPEPFIVPLINLISRSFTDPSSVLLYEPYFRFYPEPFLVLSMNSIWVIFNKPYFCICNPLLWQIVFLHF